MRSLKETLKRLGSDAVIEIIEDASHGSFVTPDLWKRIDGELLVIFERHHPLWSRATPPRTPRAAPAHRSSAGSDSSTGGAAPDHPARVAAAGSLP